MVGNEDEKSRGRPGTLESCTRWFGLGPKSWEGSHMSRSAFWLLRRGCTGSRVGLVSPVGAEQGTCCGVQWKFGGCRGWLARVTGEQGEQGVREAVVG